MSCGPGTCSDNSYNYSFSSATMSWKNDAITAATKWNINPILLLAITQMESSGNSNAMCLFSPNCTTCGLSQSADCNCGNCSYGIVQVGENNGAAYSCTDSYGTTVSTNGTDNGMLTNYNAATSSSYTPCDIMGSSGVPISYDILAEYLYHGLSAATSEGLSDVCAFAAVATSWNGNCSSSCGGSCFGFEAWNGQYEYYGPMTATGVTDYGATAAYLASNSSYWGTGVFDTTSMGSANGIVKDQLFFYAATPDDFNIAVTVAISLGVPGSNVTGDFSQAWTWADSTSHLLIAIGAFATDQMYYNPCGWNNQPIGSTPFNIVGPGPDSQNGGTPVDQLPPNNYSATSTPFFENAGGNGYLWETFVLAYNLGYYAINSEWPPIYNSNVSIANVTPSNTCPSGSSTPVGCTSGGATN